MSHDEKWILLLILASLPADSIPDDPCLIHTVLDQPWRSTDCTTGACIQDVQDDSTLTEEWYRFRSSGGWMIPETVAPNGGCSGYSAGWLNGAHPRVGDGEVTRKVCFNWNGELCIKPLDVKIKACAGFFVYRLKPTGCCGIVYCTDPASVRKPEYFDTTTKDSLENFSTASDASSGINIGVVGQGSSPKVTNQWAKDPPTDTTQEPQGATAADFGQGLTGDTAVSASSDGASLRRREYSDTTTEPQEHFSTGPDACSDGACKKTVETADSPPKRCCEAQSTSDGGPHAFKKEKAKGSAQQQSSVPAGGTTSAGAYGTASAAYKHRSTRDELSDPLSKDPQTSTERKTQGLVIEELTQEPSSVPARKTPSDPQKSTEEQTTGSVIGESTQGPSSVPAGDTSTDGASGTAQGTADQRSARIGISDLHSTSDQARATGTAPRAVGLPSTRNELSDSQATSNEDPQKSTEEQTAGSIIGESTQGPSSVPVEDTSADSQASTGKRAQGTLTGESTQGQSSAPAGDSSSASPGTAHGTTERRSTRMSISDIRSSSGEDEEFQWIQIQVTSKGGVSEEEVKQALREKLQEMFDDPDPQIERVFSDDESWDN